MWRKSPNEEAETNIESASPEREGSKNLSGQDIGGVSQLFGMNWLNGFITDISKVSPMNGMSEATKRGSELHPENDEDLYEKYSTLKKQNTSLRNKIHELQNECQVHTSMTESYIRDMKEKEMKLTDEIHELKGENQMREWEIQQAQIKSFRNIKQGRWLAQEESGVQGKLGRLQSNIKQWAKSNATKSMIEVDLMLKQTPVEHDALVTGLSKVVRLVNGALPSQIFDSAHAPFLCLNAMLANEIYTRILADPFFFLEDDIGHIIHSLPADCSIPEPRPSPNVLYGKMYDDLITGSSTFSFHTISANENDSRCQRSPFMAVADAAPSEPLHRR